MRHNFLRLFVATSLLKIMMHKSTFVFLFL